MKEHVLAAVCTAHRSISQGAAWDVFCILALTRVHYHAAVHLGTDGRVDLVPSLCTGSRSHVYTGCWACPRTMTQWAFTLTVSDPERGVPETHLCLGSFSTAHLPAEWTGTPTPQEPQVKDGSWQERRKGKEEWWLCQHL